MSIFTWFNSLLNTDWDYTTERSTHGAHLRCLPLVFVKPRVTQNCQIVLESHVVVWAEHPSHIQQAAWRVFTRLRYGPVLVLLRYIRSLLPPCLLFPPAGAPSETTGKLHSNNNTNTIKNGGHDRAYVEARTCHWAKHAPESVRRVYSPRNKDGACARWRRRASGAGVFVRTERCNIAIVARERARVVPPVGAGLRCKQEWGRGGGWRGVFIVCRWRHKHWSVVMLLCFSSATCL